MGEPLVTREMEQAGERIIDDLYGAVGSAYLARCVYIAMAEIGRGEHQNPAGRALPKAWNANDK